MPLTFRLHTILDGDFRKTLTHPLIDRAHYQVNQAIHEHFTLATMAGFTKDMVKTEDAVFGAIQLNSLYLRSTWRAARDPYWTEPPC